jgi:hypothetical protein
MDEIVVGSKLTDIEIFRVTPNLTPNAKDQPIIDRIGQVLGNTSPPRGN